MVLDAGTGQPITGGVGVVAYSVTEKKTYADYTYTGAFTITGVPAGQYKLATGYGATPDGYAPTWYGNADVWDGATVVTLGDGATVDNLNIALGHGSQIRGRITAEDTGLPLAGVRVSVGFADVSFGPGYRFRGISYRFVIANDGTYVATGLTRGPHYVQFVTGTAPGVTREYSGEYFNNSVDYAGLTPIVITAAGEDWVADAVLSRAAKITGRVLASDTGLPIAIPQFFPPDTPRGWVYAYSPGTFVNNATRVEADGSYSLTVPSGSYELMFQPPSDGFQTPYVRRYYNNALYDQRTPLNVVAPNVYEVNVNLNPGAVITGFIRDSITGAPIANASISFTRAGESRSRDDGSYVSAEGFAPGRYDIRVTAAGYLDPGTSVTIDAASTPVQVDVLLIPLAALTERVYLPAVSRE